ncbi:hypothetical protein [Thiobacillus sp.]|nr:hypothetical protein [Thiobacillus sp.]
MHRHIPPQVFVRNDVDPQMTHRTDRAGARFVGARACTVGRVNLA